MGLTILLVEQNASVALEMSHRAYVLKTGRIEMEGEGDRPAGRSPGPVELSGHY